MYAGVSAGASNFNMPNFVYGSQTSGGSAVDFSTRQTTIHGELIFGIVFNNKSGSNPLDDDQPTDHQPKKKSKKSAPSPSDSSDSKARNMRLETNVRFAQGSTTTTQVLPSVNFGTINGQTTFSSFAQETNNQLKSDLMYTDINILIKADIVPDSLQFGGTFSWSFSNSPTAYSIFVTGPSGTVYTTSNQYTYGLTTFRPGYDGTGWQGAGNYTIYVSATNASGSSVVSNITTFMN
jgi:hypothetical protein